jgi:hypothetical protein
MFYCFIDRTLKACASQTFICRLSAVFMILGAIIVGSSCGGGHSSAFTPTAAGNNPAASLNISGTLPSATVGTNYSASLSVTGGTGPYTFNVASGQLPNGIALAKDSGSVSGTPSSAGTFNFVVSALDAKGNSSLKSLQISVVGNAATSSGSGSGAPVMGDQIMADRMEGVRTAPMRAAENLSPTFNVSEDGGSTDKARPTSSIVLHRPAMESPFGCSKA